MSGVTAASRGAAADAQVELRALRFACLGCELIGVLATPTSDARRGVLVVTGGPQYRAGSHRQFVLLAAELARRGMPVLRFDYRGMGDSEGEARDYQRIEADLEAAIDAFFKAVPTLRELVLWGLCDGATAAAAYAARERRVAGLILLNPWVRTAPGMARATLRHYYLARLRQPQFWRKLMSGRFRPGAAIASLRQLASAAVKGATADAASGASARASQAEGAADPPARMLAGLSRFTGRTLIILSGEDLTAREFADVLGSPGWRQLARSPRLRQTRLPGANHTFARAAWRDEVARLSAEWIAAW
ncbi:MAG: hydrolase 1, exosortase A system-associated [Pseudomonadota bacterium]